MGWVTIRRGGKKVRVYIDNRPRAPSSNSISTSKSLHSQFIRNNPDESELQKFAKQKSLEFEKRERQKQLQKIELEKIKLEKAKQAIIEQRCKADEQQKKDQAKKKSLKIIVQTSVAVISTTDPHFAGAYLSYRFAKYGYHFIKKLKEEYQITGKWDDALLNVVSTEIRDKVSILLKNDYVQKAIELITNNLYDKFVQSDYVRIRPEFENAIKQSMVKSMHHFVVGENLESNTPETEFRKAILKIYFNDMLGTYAKENNIEYLSVGWSELEEKLSEKVLHEFEQGTIQPKFFIEGKFDGKDWLENNLPVLLELT